MRYADHKKTLDKYGGSKETISIWAPSYIPHIPKIARNSNSLLMSHVQYKQRHSPDASLPGRACCFLTSRFMWMLRLEALKGSGALCDTQMPMELGSALEFVV